MNITILGSCRQNSIGTLYNITNIKENISYTHNTKEMLEVIKFCKYGNISPDETKYIFRTPMKDNRQDKPNNPPIIWNEQIKSDFETSDLFMLEITSIKIYEYNGHYLHHIASDPLYDISIRDKIITNIQTKEEVESDILQIKSELNGKPMLIISHMCTENEGSRFMLVEWLQSICLAHNISFLNPIDELIKQNYDINQLTLPEEKLAHYTDYGHTVIQGIYKQKIDDIFLH